jgi:polyferredoxin
MGRQTSAARALTTIKVVHTVVWALFAGCILAIPVVTWYGELRAAAWLSAIVFVEVLILLFNRWSCPLTPVAARYTADRRANFDIYLPEWLARHNKTIFGALYVAGLVYAVTRWAWASGP